MTAQEKATSLVNEIRFNCDWGPSESERFGIENAVKILTEFVIPEIIQAVGRTTPAGYENCHIIDYWEDVRAELIKLK